MGRNTKIKTLIVIALIAIFTTGGLLLSKSPVFGVPYGDSNLWNRLFAEEPQYSLDPSTKGVILPHHLIAGLEINQFYKALSQTKSPKHFVIIGPNHYESGEENIYTGNINYQTVQDTVLKNNKDHVDSLSNEDFVTKASNIFEQEHSIYSHTNYIKEYFPKSTITPIMLKWETPKEDLDKLKNSLKTLDTADTFYIASVDFSHYIPHLMADFHDQKSQFALQTLQIDEIPNLEVDSWPSLYTLNTLMKDLSVNNATIHDHTNSQDFFQSTLEETTSHHFISYDKNTPSQNIIPQISYLFFGDTIFDRGILETTKDPDWFTKFAGLEERLMWGADFQSLNLEGPITLREDKQDKEVTFKHNLELASNFLTKYNFNHVNLANNHSLDYFMAGFQDTITFLESHKINWSGSYQNNNTCQLQEQNSLTVAFCGFNDVGEVLNLEIAEESIKQISKITDQIIINAHWGVEYESLNNIRQTEIAHRLIDAGADIIIGHHPHVIQPFEIYKNKPIFYSLGNFIFDQTSPNKTQIGLGVSAVISKTKTILYIFPFHTNNGNPTWMTTQERLEFYKLYLQDYKDLQHQYLDGKLVLTQQ